MRDIDIVAIKKAVKDGTLSAYVKDGIIYLRNEIGETVEIGRVDEGKTGYMSREQAVNYLRSSGMSEEQIEAIARAFGG